ncbi:MAG: manganese efflux pump MntP family protein [Spirochaetota bacterium]
MNTATIFIIALGLSMDALAVSMASGFAIVRLRFGYAVRIALFFGAFQALMPFLGWLAGISFSTFVKTIDHWIAFGLLAIIGGKMIYESFVIDAAEKESSEHSLITLLLLAVATSIDALAVGLTYACLKVAIVRPVIITGITTFVISLIGVFVGSRFGKHFENKIELVGGIILVGIGVKILIEHLITK